MFIKSAPVEEAINHSDFNLFTRILSTMYLTYLQENFKPVVYRSASVEVFDEEDAQVVHPRPSYWGCQGT